jgi:hypothetical protein
MWHPGKGWSRDANDGGWSEMSLSLHVNDDLSPKRRRDSKKLLLVGYAALVGALLVAYLSPADGYEVSIYRSTPLMFWLLVALAFIVASGVSVYAHRDALLTAVTLFLGGASATAVVGLPLLRGYRFYGTADALTHLGYVREILLGQRPPLGLFYPGSHTLSVQLSALGGLDAPRSMLIVVVSFALVFLLFVPLSVRTMVEDRRALLVAGFASFLFLPVNNLGHHLLYHPFSMTTFYFAFPMYLFLAHVTRYADDVNLNQITSAAGVLLPITSVVLVMLHPQAAFNVLLLYLTISVVQLVHYRRSNETTYRMIYGQTVVLALVFFIWATRDVRFWLTIDQIVTALVETVSGTEGAGQSVANQGDSLQDAGSSLVEIFLKLFLLKTAFVALSAGLVVYRLLGRIETDRTDRVVTYFTYAGLTLGPFFAVHYLGSISEGFYFFRHAGFVMVIATFLGSISLFLIIEWLPVHRLSLRSHAVVPVVVVVGLVLALTVLYPSPYIFKHNQHASEYQMSGYETVFDRQGDDMIVVGIRKGPNRYQDAFPLYEAVESDGAVPATVMATNVTDYYDEPHFVVVSRLDYEREVVAYKGLRYSNRSFLAFRNTDGVSRVLTNGEFDVYYVEGAEPGDTDQ